MLVAILCHAAKRSADPPGTEPAEVPGAQNIGTQWLLLRRAIEHSNGPARQPSSSSREQLQHRVDALSAQLVEAERALQAVKRERDEHKIAAANASVSELQAHKARAELDQDKRALHDAIQVARAPTPAVPIIATHLQAADAWKRPLRGRQDPVRGTVGVP